jgi:hypothetical protein
MTVLAATTLGKVAYVVFFVLVAGGVVAYGWFAADSIRRERKFSVESWMRWLASFLPPWGIRVLYLLLGILILVLGAFGAIKGHFST